MSTSIKIIKDTIMNNQMNTPFNHMYDPLNPQQTQFANHPQFNHQGIVPPGLNSNQRDLWLQQQRLIAQQQHMYRQHQQQVSPQQVNPLFDLDNHYSSGREVINSNRLIEFKNTIRVLDLAKDDDLGYYFLLDPAYVSTLLQPKLHQWVDTPTGVWFENKVYVTMSTNSDVVLSTPHVTFTIGRGSCKVSYVNPEQMMSDEVILEGVLPILRYIKSEYEAAEEAKHQKEMERLKEVERLRSIKEGRKELLSKLEAEPKRSLEDTRNLTPKGQAKKNTTTQMGHLEYLVEEKYEGARQLLYTSAHKLKTMLEQTEGGYFWIPDPARGRSVALFLHETDSHRFPKVQILGAGFDVTISQPDVNLWDKLDYADTESEELADSLALIAKLIGKLLKHSDL